MRTMLFRGGLTSIVLLTLTAAPSLAQSLVQGTVVDAQNKPVEGATILFEAQDVPNKRNTKTDKKGTFIFIGLASGPYKVTASKEGVGTEIQNVTIQQQKMQMQFVLKPAAAAAPAAAGLGGLAVGTAKPPANAKEKEAAAEIQALAASAQEAVKAERHEDAVAKLSELVTKTPACSDCYIQLGNSYSALKKYDDAETAFKKSVEIRPSVEGYTALTRLYNSQRKFDLAADASKKASDLAAAPPPAPAGAAAAGAAGATAAAAPAGTPSSETLYNQGVVLWNAGKFDEAKVQFQAAVKANPGNADAQYQLGLASLRSGEMPQAREAFEGYLKAAPEGPKAAEVKAILGQLPK